MEEVHGAGVASPAKNEPSPTASTIVNQRVILLVDGFDVRVLSLDGELLRHLTLDPSRDYQPQA